MLELYANAGCPYCQKVIKKLSDINLDFIFRSHDFTKGEESWGFKIGGKTQVPLLVDQQKGVVKYESDEIIAYLDETYSQ